MDLLKEIERASEELSRLRGSEITDRLKQTEDFLRSLSTSVTCWIALRTPDPFGADATIFFGWCQQSSVPIQYQLCSKRQHDGVPEVIYAASYDIRAAAVAALDAFMKSYHETLLEKVVEAKRAIGLKV